MFDPETGETVDDEYEDEEEDDDCEFDDEELDYDEDDDEDDDDMPFDCGLDSEGTCDQVGTEYCDACPYSQAIADLEEAGFKVVRDE